MPWFRLGCVLLAPVRALGPVWFRSTGSPLPSSPSMCGVRCCVMYVDPCNGCCCFQTQASLLLLSPVLHTVWDGSAPSWLSVALQTSSRDWSCLFQTISVLSEGPGRAGRCLGGSVTPWAGDGGVGAAPALTARTGGFREMGSLVSFCLNQQGLC